MCACGSYRQPSGRGIGRIFATSRLLVLNELHDELGQRLLGRRVGRYVLQVGWERRQNGLGANKMETTIL